MAEAFLFNFTCGNRKGGKEVQYKGKTAYVYPVDSQNRFLELNKNALSKIGFDVKPVNKSFYRNECSGKRQSYVFLNWVEDFVYPPEKCSKLQQFFRFIKAIFLVVFSKLFAEKVIWVRHNLKPHNSQSSAKRYKAIVFLYKILRIHETSLEEYYSNPSLNHPLYLSDDEILKKINERSNEDMKYEVVFFGAVKRYKNLHNLLRSWPADVNIKIAGYCNDSVYKKEVVEIIESRKLKVDWDDRFLTDKELNQLLEHSKFVLLPHADGTMISSGTFYHALSYGCNILVTESKFGLQKSLDHEFVHLYKPGEFSYSFLNSVFIAKNDVYKKALENYGEKSVTGAWSEILEKY